MNIDKISTIFEQYGWPGILAIGLVLIIWYIIQKQLKKSSDASNKTLATGLKDIATTIHSQNDYLIQTFTQQSIKQQEKIFELLKESLSNHDKVNEERHSKSINQRFKITYAVMDKLTDLMNYHNAQRVTVIEFHNSKENFNGLSFIWYDIQYEVHQKNITPIASKCKEMQVSNIYHIINDLYDKDGIVIYHDKHIEDEMNIYSDFEDNTDVKAIIYSGIYNENNDLIGLVCIEYIKYDMPEDLDKEDLWERTSAISTLLNFNNLVQ